ncbi:MAG: hypothetical protein DRO67_06885 [Candidatus Asgardarchaeum californiense]|nr:MAG: hypothetical protein DRO67_06885 [Candidatus Asgardarchaeum californiense]
MKVKKLKKVVYLYNTISHQLAYITHVSNKDLCLIRYFNRYHTRKCEERVDKLCNYCDRRKIKNEKILYRNACTQLSWIKKKIEKGYIVVVSKLKWELLKLKYNRDLNLDWVLDSVNES